MNEPKRRGPIFRFFKGLWDAMNFTRRLVFNLIFFGLLILILAALGSGDRTKPLLDRTTLVLQPEGRLVEQYSCDAFTRQLMVYDTQGRCAEVQVRDLLRAIEAAKDDKRIERVVLNVDGLAAGGQAMLRPIAAKLAELRASGKQIVAYGDLYDQNAYLLAAQASEVYTDPMGGGVALLGMARSTPYMRELLSDKLGVDVHVFKVGEFKSAVEPFILDGASPEAKEADLYWMNDVWQRQLADIAKARKLDAATLAASIDSMPQGVQALGGDLAKYALQQKLVDGLKTRTEVEELLVERGEADDTADGGFRQISLQGYLAHLDTALSKAVDKRPQVAVVVAEGEILDGEQPLGTVGGDTVAALLRDAREDDDVKAVVLRVNSPGGSAYASEVINREVLALKAAGKPVVASMGQVAASGGYWISMNGDRVYADASTITGSIGVFGMIPTVPRTLEKIGVRTDGVSTTSLADAFDITQPLKPELGQIVQSGVDKVYRDFTTKVAQGRKSTPEAIDLVARGRVWSGAQAKARGLVDELGDLDAALADAATRAKLGKPADYRVRYMEASGSPLEQFFGGMATTRVGAWLMGDSSLLRSLLARDLPVADAQLRMVDSALRQRKSGQPAVFAHCMCGE